MLMKYKDFKQMSNDEMKNVTGGWGPKDQCPTHNQVCWSNNVQGVCGSGNGPYGVGCYCFVSASNSGQLCPAP
jgi:bacteriocin-like protein